MHRPHCSRYRVTLTLTSFSRRLYDIQSSCSVSASGSKPSNFLIWLRARLRTSRLVKLPRLATFSMLLVDSVKCLGNHAFTGELVCRQSFMAASQVCLGPWRTCMPSGRSVLRPVSL